MPEACSPGGWTLDTLERHLTEKVAALDRFCVTNFAQSKERVDMALAASDKAITKAEVTTEKRFEGVNEFRAALSDQSATLLPRAEYAVQHKAVLDHLAILNEFMTKAAGRGEGMGTIGTIVLGLMIGLNSLVSLGALAVAVAEALIPRRLVKFSRIIHAKLTLPLRR